MTLEETLLKDYSVDVMMMDRKTVPDGYGGFHVQWVDGAVFKVALTSAENGTAKIAEAISEIKKYKVITETTITLRQNDYIKRISDGAVFKIIRDNTDNLTPKDSTIPMRYTEAERTELPDE